MASNLAQKRALVISSRYSLKEREPGFGLKSLPTALTQDTIAVLALSLLRFSPSQYPSYRNINLFSQFDLTAYRTHFSSPRARLNSRPWITHGTGNLGRSGGGVFFTPLNR